ncbi:hypothetical protein [Pontibacter anaerobius]|uniref:Uncharacterized protein n=1 Tax=Pontibacter anaerobius TaxID=2993940 RepID=A0ABT3RAD8_9BACT|nr:hypothetical protein [Pontibacter anaerobius]MCX2738827.1 hypothetical protein [Pontibacter anaerobius]
MAKSKEEFLYCNDNFSYLDMKTAVVLGIVALALPIAFILIGYYLDYRSNKTGFLKDAKSIAAGLLLIIAVYFFLNFAGKGISSIFPINSNHGKTYNDFRAAKGIPVIESSWKVWPFAGNKYEVWWADSLNTDANIHTFKIIKYNLWGPVSEIDYFELENKGSRLETIYDYSHDTLVYTKITPKSASLVPLTGRTLPDTLYETTAPISPEDFKYILSEVAVN